MYLKSIIINGFKSFSEKKEFNIDNGITGIVGPNGSGKSNVCDAVRWVLGEQSSKSLRGDKMLDVIFGGTDTRKQKSSCEVQLTFDNQSSILSTDHSEVSISRKLYRSGESEYQINKSACRLKDILELFRDTGIGKEGYSIIGQGRIDEILTERSIERRKIFEEAAGIMKYRVKKEEAERKLTKTKDNLVRLKDIINEIEIQIEPMKLQCEQTRQYIELADRQKLLEVNLYINAYEKHNQSITDIKGKINEIEEEKTELEKELQFLTQDSHDIDTTNSNIDEKIEKLNKNITSFHMEIERIDGEINLTNQKRAFLEKEIDRLQEENMQSEQLCIEKAQETERIEQQTEQKQQALSTIKQEVESLNEKLIQKQQDQQSDTKIIGEIKSGVLEHLGELSNVKIDISSIKTTVASSKNRISDIEQDIAKNNTEIEKNKQQKQNIEQQFDALNEQSKTLSDQVFNMKKEYTQSEVDLSKATTSLYDIEKKIEGISSRKKLLLEMKDNFEGYYNSVKRLMLEKEKHGFLKEKIISTVASAIVVPKEYETAIEVALGNAVQNIIVGTDYDAKDIINFLKKNDIGRVTFLPLNALKQRHLTEPEKKYLDIPGVIGCACDLIDFDQKVSTAIEYLLARTVICDTTETAIALMQKSSYSFRTVTLQGELLNPGGVITGGSLKKSQSGLLSRERVLTDMENNEKTLNQKADEIRANFILLREKLKQTSNKRDSLSTQQRENEVQTAGIIEQLKALSDTNTRLNQQIETLTQELDKLTFELNKADKIAKELMDKQNSLHDSSGQTEEKIKDLESKYLALCDKIDEMKTNLADKNIEINTKQSEIDALNIEHIRLNQDIQSLKTESLKKKESIENSKTEIADLNNQVLIISGNLSSKKQFVESAKQELEKIQLEKKLIYDQNKSRQTRKEEIRDQISNLMDKHHKAEISIAKAESNLEYLQNKTWDSYQLTYANALKYKTNDITVSKANKEIEQIKSAIREMGDVNPHAIEDYQNLTERYDYLFNQEQDLLKASEDLEKIIDGLMDKMKHSFSDKFNLINQNFKQVFKELFGGGNVDLILEDKTNIMESGIQIVAEPPGKRLQNIMLLSGGEKALTAIALLFALLKINPSPICILDEIDAALDDANVNKFSEFLRSFNNVTQFIVITHRKPTMSVCDVLYGLAMREKGVTDVLSVKIN